MEFKTWLLCMPVLKRLMLMKPVQERTISAAPLPL
jgi:hypothetical protein